jgi:hypothetical protein
VTSTFWLVAMAFMYTWLILLVLQWWMFSRIYNEIISGKLYFVWDTVPERNTAWLCSLGLT